MTRILTITNQKGGVGKTTTALNLAASLAATKRNILLIDMDPQGNATMGAGIDKYELEKSARAVLLGEESINDVIITCENWGFDVLPGGSDLTVAEVTLVNEFAREYKLKRALEELETDYDYILIDCPPSLNMLTVNALVASEGAIIPMQCEYYALEGLTSLIKTINDIKESVNPDLEIEGLLRTMFDPRNNLANDVSEQLTGYFGDKVYNTIIPRNVRLAEAPSHGIPILHYDKQSRGAIAYLALAGEILRGDANKAEKAQGQ